MGEWEAGLDTGLLPEEGEEQLPRSDSPCTPAPPVGLGLNFQEDKVVPSVHPPACVLPKMYIPSSCLLPPWDPGIPTGGVGEGHALLRGHWALLCWWGGGGVEKQGRCMCGGVGCMWWAWGGMNSGVRIYGRDSLWQGECSGVALVGEGRGEGGVKEEGATGELRHICSAHQGWGSEPLRLVLNSLPRISPSPQG